MLATKLYLPGPRPDLVPRPRLLARLDEGLARGLVLVCAPAGYGKTVLLADWARRGSHPVAWLSLDAGDNDPARFWRHVVAALDRARPGTGERVAPLLGPPAPSSFQGLVTALINDLAGGGGLLVLDDYHVIGSPQVHESLAFLAEHRPAGICVMLASRSDPPLPLARLRARGQLTEIRVAELRFTPAEAGGAAPARGVGPARMRRWRRWRPGPRAGRPGCSWPRCPCADRRCRRFRGRVHRQPPVRPGLPGRRGARAAGRAAAHVPARDLGPRAAFSGPLCTPSPAGGQPGAARGGRTGGAVPDPAG